MTDIQDLIGKIHFGDCLDIMRQMPDKCVDLVLTDPPYGGHASKDNISCTRTGGSWAKKYQQINSIKNWDLAPNQEYFDEIFRISKNQIIWGGNYFSLPPTRCFNIWKKLTISEMFSMAMAEYAWTSFNSNAKLWEFVPQNPDRFHPTQKPIELIVKQVLEYSKENDIIFDPFIGSGTTAIACVANNRQFIGIEKDPDYHRGACGRLEKEKFNLFNTIPKNKRGVVK